MSHSSLPRPNPSPEPSTFLRMRSVVQITGLARSTIYRLVASKQFPAQVRLSQRAVGWRRSDVQSWNESRPTIED